jgi:hypothetical protein
MLLEMGVVITATAVLLYGAMFLFSSFQRIDRTARERVKYGRDLMRLAEQFRSDVHAAREIEELRDHNGAGNNPLARLAGEKDQSVEYLVGENGQLVRTLTNSDKIVEREVFDFGSGTRFSIDVRRDGVALVTLVITKAGDASGEVNPPTIQRRVAAVLSRDGRYAAGGDPQ